MVIQLGPRIKRIREALGYKQSEMARLMEVTQQAYSGFEKGENPKWNTLCKFCTVTGIEMMFLTSDIPIDEVTLAQYGKMKYSELIVIPRGVPVC